MQTFCFLLLSVSATTDKSIISVPNCSKQQQIERLTLNERRTGNYLAADLLLVKEPAK